MIDSQYFESKMQSKLFFLLVNIVLAVLIFYNAELGRLLGLQGQPLEISLVWPSTGFSLAALLLFGLKTWPGIFLGNFIYNFYHLSLFTEQPSYSLVSSLAAGLVSLGSLLQALLAFSILRAFSSSGYFNTVKDIIIFLIPAGLLSCLVGSTIGVTTISYFYKTFNPQNFFNTWLTFWIGDSMGVYIFTPLIVVWTIHRRSWPEISQYFVEFIFMIVTFVTITVLTFVKDYPLVHIYIPFIIWVAYRFRMHGSTLVSFFITLAIIIATSYGHGPFNAGFQVNSLLFLVTLLEIIVATSLIIAAIVNERDAAWHQIQNHNIDLQQVVEGYLEERKGSHYETFINEKIGSLGLLTTGVARQLQNSIEKINVLSTKCRDHFSKLQNSFNGFKDQIEQKKTDQFQNDIDAIDNSLSNLVKFTGQAIRITKVIEDMSVLTAPGLIKFKFINFNTLLDKCLSQVLTETDKNFPIKIVREFDKSLQMILALPEDIGYVFLHLINHAAYSIKEKKEKLNISYFPEIKVQTIDHDDVIEVVIHDNGMGASQFQLKDFFSLFFVGKPSIGTDSFDETARLSLVIARDIVVHVYRGEIKVDAKEGEYTKITIKIPKDTIQEALI